MQSYWHALWAFIRLGKQYLLLLLFKLKTG